MIHYTLPIIKKTLISASPIIVSTPFAALGLTTFDKDEERALWQPPNYVFGIVWPTLYFLLFTLNWNVLSSIVLDNNFKKKFIKYTIIESILQGTWLYNFRYKKSIKGREKKQYFYGLISTNMLVFLTYTNLNHLISTKNKIYILLYIPYFLWIQLANILNYQLYFGFTKNKLKQ